MDLRRKHQNLQLTYAEIQFKNPLFYDDEFTISCGIRRESKIRLIVKQVMYRGKALILTARIDIIGTMAAAGKTCFKLPDTLIQMVPEAIIIE